MFTNYFKIALRTLLRSKAYSLINIVGLALGMAAVLLIAMFVRDELSFDGFHANKDTIYRTIYQWKTRAGKEIIFAMNEHKLAPLLKQDFPEAKEICRIGQYGIPVRNGDKVFQEDNFFVADANVFSVFTLPFVSGDPKTALQEPLTVVLSESMAKKYFGSEDPMGKILGASDTLKFKVTGVMRDMPKNSHFRADFICSMKSDRWMFSDLVFQNWGEMAVYTYLLLPDKATAANIQGRLEGFLQKHLGKEQAANAKLLLQPLLDIHLHNYESEITENGDQAVVTVFIAIAVAILLIAAINYMNLATARSSLRAKEIGVRKTSGARRSQLIVQFMSESLLLSTIALFLAFLLVEVSLPMFNSFTRKELSLSAFGWGWALVVFPCIALLVGLIAGSYPAFFLSSFQPVKVLKGDIARGVRGGMLRKILVTTQFCVSIALIAATLVVYNQLVYVQSKSLGYDTKQVIVPLTTRDMARRYETVKADVQSIPGVQAVSKTSKQLGGQLTSNLGFRAEGVPPEKIGSIKVVAVDHDFFKTISGTIVEGRDFSKSYPTDAEDGFILNETAVNAFGWTSASAVGKTFETQTLNEQSTWMPKKGRIVGVVKDFHYEPLYRKIVPTVFYISPNWGGSVVIKTERTDLPAFIASLQTVWNKYAPGQPFEYSFLDEKLKGLYETQQRFGVLVGGFAGLAIIIACLGLLGLAAFTAEQRTKEIGIRKVLGASAINIVTLLSKDFLALVGIAFLVACPLVWYAMNRWLQDFAYRIELNVGVFLLAGILAVVIAFVTVAGQAWRAAQSNPVKSLRTE